MAKQALEKYDTDIIKRTFDMLLWAWITVPDYDDDIIKIRDAMLNLIYDA